MLNESDTALRILYLELLRAQTTKNDVCNVQKAVKPQECWRQSDRIGWCPTRETLGQTQIVEAEHLIL